MKRSILSLTLLTTLVIGGSTGCKQRYHMPEPTKPYYSKANKDYREMGEEGEKYTRRPYTVTDISVFKPKDDEPYDVYRARMLNTLLVQAEEIEALEQGIDSKAGSLENLNEQYSFMSNQQNELRIALVEYEQGIAPSHSQQRNVARRVIPFDHYTIHKGETLQKISQDRYGTYTGWLALYRFNHKRLPYGPNRLEEGDKLLIPNIEIVNSRLEELSNDM